MLITLAGPYYRIEFRYQPHLVEAVKQLPGKRWEPVSKCWLVPAGNRMEVERFAYKYGFKWGGVKTEEQVNFVIPPMPELTSELPALKLAPFHYQAQGIAYNLLHRRTIVGDKPGLGKTAQAIATIVAAGAYPCIVVCPSALKINWQREWGMWTGRQRALILNDSVRRTFPQFW
jgi:SWI/SNF-related matrix-associated actin-dependent regulator 1 of chromatin subfamily A